MSKKDLFVTVGAVTVTPLYMFIAVAWIREMTGLGWLEAILTVCVALGYFGLYVLLVLSAFVVVRKAFFYATLWHAKRQVARARQRIEVHPAFARARQRIEVHLAAVEEFALLCAATTFIILFAVFFVWVLWDPAIACLRADDCRRLSLLPIVLPVCLVGVAVCMLGVLGSWLPLSLTLTRLRED